MKKSIVLSLACFTISISNYAQLAFRGHIGVNSQKIDYETIQGQIKGTTGFSFGIDAQFGNRLYFQPGINYTGKKFKIDGVGDITANKINVPVLVGLRLFKPKSSFSNNIRIFVGPNLSTTVSERIADAITDVNKDDLKNFNFAAIGGVGFDLRVFFLDLGYKYGLSNFINKNGTETPLNGFNLNAGLRF